MALLTWQVSFPVRSSETNRRRFYCHCRSPLIVPFAKATLDNRSRCKLKEKKNKNKNKDYMAEWIKRSLSCLSIDFHRHETTFFF